MWGVLIIIFFFLYIIGLAIQYKFIIFAIIGLVVVFLIAKSILITVFSIIRKIYYFFNPIAKRKYLERLAKEKADQEAHAIAENARQKAREEAERAEQKAREEAEKTELENAIAKQNAKKKAREQHRDADIQDVPYTYQIGQHGNESLAIRYGIANQEKKIKEYWYHTRGGEKVRNQDRDTICYEPSATIQLKKIRKMGKEFHYKVLLTDYRDRHAIAVIEVGTEYVKTFYPLDDSWFDKYADLELTLKGNGSFTLKELAKFHVDKTIGR